MRVFRQIVVVGVGAAITFSNPGQSVSAQPPAQSQDGSALSNQLELGQNVRSTSNTSPESVSEVDRSIAPNPPSSNSVQPGFVNIASTPPTQPEQASKPQQAAPASAQKENLAQSPKPAPRGTQQKPVPSRPNNVPAPSLPSPAPRGTPNESG